MSAVRGPLRKHGIRLTRQRELLFDLINKSHVHLNADQLYELAKTRDARINRVTVYRTLKILKQEGLIDELDLLHYEGDQHYYETRLKREHAHIVCLRCGSIQEYFGEPLRVMKQQIESDFGFQIALARTEVGGYCADCQTSAALEKESEKESTVAEATSSPAKLNRDSPHRASAAR